MYEEPQLDYLEASVWELDLALKTLDYLLNCGAEFEYGKLLEWK